MLWAALNPDHDAFSPFGFSTALYQHSETEPPVGQATVTYQLMPQLGEPAERSLMSPGPIL